MKRKGQNGIPGGWLFLSAAAHFILLAGMVRFATSDPGLTERERMISVVMVTLTADAPAQKSAPVVRGKQPFRTKHSKSVAVRAEPKLPVVGEPTLNKTVEPAPSEPKDPPVRISDPGPLDPAPEVPGGRSAEFVSAREEAAPPIPEGYLAEIRMRIERAKHYPWSARVRGQEGTSLVRFWILPNGSVREVAIRRSSDYKVLDEAAIRTVERAAPFPAPPAEVAAENIEINLPMVFELH